MLKRFLSVLCIIGVLTINSYWTDVFAYDVKNISIDSESRYDQVANFNSNASNLVTNSNDKSAYGKLLRKNVNKDTGVVDSEVERTLNEIGVFDEEIQNYPEELLNFMNDGYKYEIYIDYSAINEEGIAKSLTQDEINEYYREKQNDEMRENLSSIFSIEEIKVSAATKTQIDVGESSSGMLRQVLTVSQTNNSKKIYVHYIATWVEEPYYRNTDAISIGFENASYDKDSVACYYYYAYEMDYMAGIKLDTIYESGAIDIMKKGDIYYSTSAILVEFDIPGSRSEIISYEYASNGCNWKYTTDKIAMHCYVTIDEEKTWKYITVTGDYWHQKVAGSLNPSFSLAGDGVSFSISPNFEKKYTHMSDNPYVKFYYK